MNGGRGALVAGAGHRGLYGDPARAAPFEPIAACAVAAVVSLAFAAQWWAEAVGADTNGYLLYLLGGLYAPRFDEGEIFRLFTAPLLHTRDLHFMFNLSALMALGAMLEPLIGHARCLLVVALSMLAGSLAAVAVQSAEGVMVGSSGGAFGMIGAMWVLSLREGQTLPRRLRGLRWLLPIALAADSSMLLWIPERVGWIAHLGGLAGGMGAMALMSRGAGPVPLLPSSRRTRWAAAGLAALFLCAVAVDVQRVASGRICEVILRDDLSEAERAGFQAALRKLPVVCPGFAPEPLPANPSGSGTPARPRTRSSANRRAP